MIVSSLHIYPIKSCGSITLQETNVFARGLQHDRRYMVVDNTGKFMTQRHHPKMALISVALAADGLVLNAPDMPVLDVAVPNGPRMAVEVWKSALELPIASYEVNEWLSQFLGQPCRLVHLPDSITRTATSSRAKEGDEVSLADGFPLLITTTASLADLNTRLPAPLPMNRFRPNVVIDGATAWDEDSWHLIQVGDIRLEMMKPCSRCNMTQVDQALGVEDGKEPIRTLRKFRFSKDEMGMLFGVNATMRNTQGNEGIIRVGDGVVVETRQRAPELARLV